MSSSNSVSLRDGERGPNSEILITSGDVIVHVGPIPPLHVRQLADPVMLPGVNIDIDWILTTGPIGPGRWRQLFRDGLEIADSANESAARLELTMTYSQMLYVCYGGWPIESVLTPSEVLPLITPLSCLTGLLHGRQSLRLGLLPEPVLQAICAWSDSSGMP
jgi:hypothetical protein